RERMTDIRDVISRIGSHLTLQAPLMPAAQEEERADEPVILVAHEILPSQAMSLGNLPIAGIVTETGGGTSHAAILSRSRGIPARRGGRGDPRGRPLGRPDGRRRPRRPGARPARSRGDRRLPQAPARVLRPEGPAGPEPRPAGPQLRRLADRA